MDKNEKLIEQKKVLNLINRIYRGERIDEKQFYSIYEYIQSEGVETSRTIKQRVPIYQYETFVGCEEKTIHQKGKYWCGLFAAADKPQNEYILLHDVRNEKTTRIQHEALSDKNKVSLFYYSV